MNIDKGKIANLFNFKRFCPDSASQNTPIKDITGHYLEYNIHFFLSAGNTEDYECADGEKLCRSSIIFMSELR